MKVVDETVDVDQLIAAIKQGISAAGLSFTTRDRDLRILTIELKLEVVAESFQGGSLRFRLPIIGFEGKGGGGVTSRNMHTITLVLQPREKSAVLGVRAGEDVVKAIVDAVKTVRQTVHLAEGGADPWILRSAKVDIKFGVTAEITGACQHADNRY
jgi:hypothetical protein